MKEGGGVEPESTEQRLLKLQQYDLLHFAAFVTCYRKLVAYLFSPSEEHRDACERLMNHLRETQGGESMFLGAGRLLRGEHSEVDMTWGAGSCDATFGFDSPRDPHEAQALLREIRRALVLYLQSTGVSPAILEAHPTTDSAPMPFLDIELPSVGMLIPT